MQQRPNSEREVITFASEVGLLTFFPRVGPEQTPGIETNEYAHELATATGWIGYIEWLRVNGICAGVPGKRIGYALFVTHPYPGIRELTLGDTP